MIRASPSPHRPVRRQYPCRQQISAPPGRDAVAKGVEGPLMRVDAAALGQRPWLAHMVHARLSLIYSCSIVSGPGWGDLLRGRRHEGRGTIAGSTYEHA